MAALVVGVPKEIKDKESRVSVQPDGVAELTYHGDQAEGIRYLLAQQPAAEVEKQFASEGATVVKKSPTEFGAFMVSEMNKWEQVVKKGGIKAE